MWTSPSPEASPEASPSPAFYENVVDIIVPDMVEEGFQEIIVFEDGEPAQGTVRITSPKGKLFARELDETGSIDFFFDGEGFWRIEYGDAGKVIEVVAKKKPSPLATLLVPTASPFEGLGTPTGLVVAGLSDWQWALLLLLLLVLTYLAYKYLYAVVKLEKRFDGKKVELRVVNRRGDLKSLELLDVAPEDGEVKAFSEKPVEKDTITGKVLSWKRKALKKGESWTVSYSLNTKAKELKHAELKAIADKGEKVLASS